MLLHAITNNNELEIEVHHGILFGLRSVISEARKTNYTYGAAPMKKELFLA